MQPKFLFKGAIWLCYCPQYRAQLLCTLTIHFHLLFQQHHPPHCFNSTIFRGCNLMDKGQASGFAQTASITMRCISIHFCAVNFSWSIPGPRQWESQWLFGCWCCWPWHVPSYSIHVSIYLKHSLLMVQPCADTMTPTLATSVVMYPSPWMSVFSLRAQEQSEETHTVLIHRHEIIGFFSHLPCSIICSGNIEPFLPNAHECPTIWHLDWTECAMGQHGRLHLICLALTVVVVIVHSMIMPRLTFFSKGMRSHEPHLEFLYFVSQSSKSEALGRVYTMDYKRWVMGIWGCNGRLTVDARPTTDALSRRYGDSTLTNSIAWMSLGWKLHSPWGQK